MERKETPKGVEWWGEQVVWGGVLVWGERRSHDGGGGGDGRVVGVEGVEGAMVAENNPLCD
jgi:hypothetical protein